jgi:hypothetical protein
MIVSLETQWCSWCVVMEQQVFRAPEVVRRFGTRYVWVRLDAEADPEGVAAQRRFRTTSYPYTAIVDPNDGLFISINGYRDVPAFIHDVDDATAELRSIAELNAKVLGRTASPGEYLKLAEEYERRGSFRRAAAVFKTLLQVPSLADADQVLFNLAICQASAGDRREAEST